MAALATEPSTRLRGDDSDIGAFDSTIGATEGGLKVLDSGNLPLVGEIISRLRQW